MLIKKYESVNDYIFDFPLPAQNKMLELREIIHSMDSSISEAISYNMPSFRFNIPLVSFAAYKNHIGFYPGAKAIAKFSGQFTNLRHSKGGVRFPIDLPLPTNLIKEIVKFRLEEDFLKKKN